MNEANKNLEKILVTVQSIPAGKVATYGQIADLAGLPGRARLVGKALGNVPKGMQVPWHRVIRSSGQIAFPIGSDTANEQKGKLQTENVVVNGLRIKLKEFQWQPDLFELMFKTSG